jgi:hypothetical protein
MSSLYNLREYGLGNECGCGAFGDTRDIEAKWMRMKAKYMMSQTKFYDLWEQFEKDPKMYEVSESLDVSMMSSLHYFRI